jgi:uncharacterized protein (DUF58 family)
MLETRYPLGLFRAWSFVRPEARALVYPQPEASALPPPSPETSAGSARLIARGTDDFSGLRAYQFSDSPRHVAWKAVAKNDDMLTKQFSGQSSAELWLDWTLLAPDADTERRLSRLAGWVLAAQRAGARYGLAFRAVRCPIGVTRTATCSRRLRLTARPASARRAKRLLHDPHPSADARSTLVTARDMAGSRFRLRS